MGIDLLSPEKWAKICQKTYGNGRLRSFSHKKPYMGPIYLIDISLLPKPVTWQKAGELKLFTPIKPDLSKLLDLQYTYSLKFGRTLIDHSDIMPTITRIEFDFPRDSRRGGYYFRGTLKLTIWNYIGAIT